MLVAYHNKPELKEWCINEMAMHRKAETLIKGRYWENGKGCAVGCLIKGSNHEAYEPEFGIPQMLARLEDCIFEGLPDKDAKKWPERFLKAIKPGADLSRVGWQFLYWNLTENLVLKDSDNAEIQKAIIQCREAIKECGDAICPLTKGKKTNKKKINAARSAARSAAESAARSAAESAAWSAASAESAARSAAWSAESAARRAAWSAARSAAESAAYIKMADKLIELLEQTI